jgi:hypothetical protein
MSDDEAAPGDAVRIEPQITDLTVHLLQNRAHHLGIVGCPIEVALADSGIKKFDIGEIDIDDAVEGRITSGLVAATIYTRGRRKPCSIANGSAAISCDA